MRRTSTSSEEAQEPESRVKPAQASGERVGRLPTCVSDGTTRDMWGYYLDITRWYHARWTTYTNCPRGHETHNFPSVGPAEVGAELRDHDRFTPEVSIPSTKPSTFKHSTPAVFGSLGFGDCTRSVEEYKPENASRTPTRSSALGFVRHRSSGYVRSLTPFTRHSFLCPLCPSRPRLAQRQGFASG